MASYQVHAHNWATASENKIHDDAVASRYGFRGGLVPGVAVWAYMTHPPAEQWGLDWLRHGTMQASFGSPVYEGELVRVQMDSDGGLALSNEQGEQCARGVATTNPGPPPAEVADSSPMPDPRDRPPADESSLAAGTVLGSVEGHFAADRAIEYLGQIGETLALYEKEGVAHPGWLLLSANTVLSGTVRLGPWIHVSSDASMYRTVTDGQFVSTRARVRDLFERKGHRFVRLDVHVLADGELAMAVDHTAIYKVREPQ